MVKEYKGYKIDSSGIAYGLNGTILKGDLNSKGYKRIYVKGKHVLLHRLVAILFIPNPLNLPQVNHKDGNKTNNDYTNLEWMTNAQNRQHAIITMGNHAFQAGSKHLNSKLNEEQVEEILLSKLKPKELAVQYNISLITIYKILTRVYWKHVQI